MSGQDTHHQAAATPHERRLTIFELLSEYHRSLDSMKRWLETADLSESERIGIADAWQHEMVDWFRSHGYCFGCNRPLDRCHCT